MHNPKRVACSPFLLSTHKKVDWRGKSSRIPECGRTSDLFCRSKIGAKTCSLEMASTLLCDVLFNGAWLLFCWLVCVIEAKDEFASWTS